MEKRPGKTPMDMRTDLRLATWNVLSLNEIGADELLVRELDRLNVEIGIITEVRWPQSGQQIVGGSTFLWSGRDDGKKYGGVALVLSKFASNSLVSWNAVSERILTAVFKHKHGRLNIVACYAPTNTSEDTEKEEFYTSIDSIFSKFGRHDLSMLVGDINATVGTNRDGYERILGPWGSGVRNDNGTRLLEACTHP